MSVFRIYKSWNIKEIFWGKNTNADAGSLIKWSYSLQVRRHGFSSEQEQEYFFYYVGSTRLFQSVKITLCTWLKQKAKLSVHLHLLTRLRNPGVLCPDQEIVLLFYNPPVFK